MMHRIIILLAALSMTACAHTMNTDSSELDAARNAIAAAKAAGAERCAPKLQAQAVATLYWAAHELTEVGYHPDETSELVAKAEALGKEAHNKARKGCNVVVEVINLDGVYFANDSAALKPASIATLDRGVVTLKKRSKIKVEVAAHTDSSGSEAYNQALSQRRAASVKEYLVTHGVSSNRLTAKGYGEAKPIASNGDSAGRAKNRRVELRVLSK